VPKQKPAVKDQPNDDEEDDEDENSDDDEDDEVGLSYLQKGN
jgi:hypothetical protein